MIFVPVPFDRIFQALNQGHGDIAAAGLTITSDRKKIVTEDILEFVNVGVVDITVADHHIARAWSQVLPDIVVRNDLWFFNVENIAAEVIGKETVNYVANINKYYVAYQLYYDMYRQREKTKESFLRDIDDNPSSGTDKLRP
jgi:membrane-bound lytic murein transglycosylase MltF